MNFLMYHFKEEPQLHCSTMWINLNKIFYFINVLSLEVKVH